MLTESPPLLAGILERRFHESPIKGGAFSTVKQEHIIELRRVYPGLNPELFEGLSERELELVERLLMRGCPFERADDLKSFEALEKAAYGFLHRVQELSAIKMSREEADQFIQDIVDIYAEDPGQFNEFQTQLNDFLQEAGRIQAQRPKKVVSLFDTTLMNRQIDLAGFTTFETQTFREVVGAVIETTSCDNFQLLHENWEACAIPEDARTVQYLQPRRNETHLCLFREQHPHINLQGMADDEIVDTSNWKTEIYFTHPDTMETRAIRLDFPVKREMTVKEAKELLVELKQYIQQSEKTFMVSHQGFRDLKAFRKYVKLGEQVFIQAQTDFREPSGLYARKAKSTAAFLKKPNPKTALAAIADRSIYAGHPLSLLPLGGFERYTTVDEEDYMMLMTAFLRGGGQAKMKMPEGEADVSIEIERQADYRVMTTTIRQDGKEISRKTYYPNSWADDTVVETGLLERDFLLAKAAFLEGS